MNGISNPARVQADLERRRSGVAQRQDGAKRKLKHNRSAAKRSWKQDR